MKLIIDLLKLTKPGVLIGNAITVPAGFLFASRGDIDWALLLATFTGSSLIIASACVFNNYFDRDIDAKMTRTKTRPMITGAIPGWLAIVWGTLLGLAGVWLLYEYTNLLVVIVGIVGFIDYVFLYGMWTKRTTWHGTLVGSISGAIPILAGYVAVSNEFDLGAILVFLVLFIWQMPEFYSIAIYRKDEYAAANIPVISVVKGVGQTKRYIFAYTALFTITTLSLFAFSLASLSYFVVMVLANGYWLWLAAQGFTAKDDNAWAKRMFKFSLYVLLLFCILISLNNLVY